MKQLSALATDLDGTLIPLDGDTEQIAALKSIESLLASEEMSLLFVTGRSASLTTRAMREFGLPRPDAILCDVGSCLLTLDNDADEFTRDDDYHAEVLNKLGGWTHTDLTRRLSEIGLPVRPQEPDKQTDVKCSFYFDAQRFGEVENETARWIADQSAPVQIVISIDPFNGDGLLDLLPMGVNKAFGLNWWRESHNLSLEQIAFSGDSGNDIAAMTSGVKSIVVANAVPELIAAASDFHAGSGKVFLAQRPATLGVLDGLRHFLSL